MGLEKKTLKRISKPQLGLHKLKQHKQWSDEECLQLLDERKQAKMPWLPAPNQNNVDNVRM